MRVGIRKAGNAGLITTTAPGAPAPGDLCHTMPVRVLNTAPRTARITKIMAWNPGAAVPLLFGTNNRAGVPAFVQLLPTLWALAGLDNEWTEEEIAAVEWASDESLLAAGRTGNIVVIAGTAAIPVAGVVIQIEVEEFGQESLSK